MEIRQRYYYEKQPDGSRRQVMYYPVTSSNAVVVDEDGTTLDTKLEQLQPKGDYVPNTTAGANALMSALPTWTADPTDNVYLLRRDTGGAASFGQVKFSTVWNYIKSKISTVLGLTESEYSGKAATAGVAEKVSISDGSTNVFRKMLVVNENGIFSQPYVTANYSTGELKAKKFLVESAGGTDKEFTASRTGGSSVSLMVGSSNANHGVYSNTAGKWLVYADGNGNVTLNGKASTAGVADKLGTSSVGASNLPVYLNGGTPTAVTSVGESFISWGGKNFEGTYGCIDAAMVSDLGANRLAFAKAEGVEIQYSRDGGVTWEDYGATDAQKTGLFTIKNAQSFTVGKNSAATQDDMIANPTNYLLRIYLRTGANGAGIYTVLNKFLVYVSTNGSQSTWMSLDVRTQENYENGVDTWVNRANKVPVSGWSGYNVINITGSSTYGNTKNTQYGEWRFTFGCDGYKPGTNASTGKLNAYYGLTINSIFGFGGMGWTTPSTLASTGHLYSFDALKNATFPAKVTATAFARPGGTSSQFLKADGSVDSTKYLVASDISGKVDKVSGKGLSTNDYTTDEKDKLAGIAAGADVNVNADWDATSGDAQILHKPTAVSAFSNDAQYTSMLAAFPVFDNMSVKKTIEFDIAATTYYRILTCANALSKVGDLVNEHAYFRITITSSANSSIYSVVDVMMNYRVGLGSSAPMYVTHNRTNSTSGATTGLQYLRYVYPSDMYSGGLFGLDMKAYNATARHIKIEVFDHSAGIIFMEELTSATVASTETSSTIALYTTRGIQSNMFGNVSVSTATNASYPNTIIPVSLGTMPLAGEALLVNSLAFFAPDGRIYPASNTTRPICGAGALNGVRAAVSLNAAVGYTSYGNKISITALTNLPPTDKTLVRGKPVFLRCTHRPALDVSNSVDIPQTLSGRYYSVSGAVGTVVSMSGTSSSSWYGYMRSCSEGDVVIITSATAATNARGWAFLDANDKIISVCDGLFTLNEEILVAPPGTAKVVSNSKGVAPRYIAKADIRYSDTRIDVFSDNLLTQTQAPGYSYIRVGWASDTALNVDTAGSKIYTLDAAGRLTHLDGISIVPEDAMTALLKRISDIEESINDYVSWDKA